MEYGEGADPDQTTREGQAPAASRSFPGGFFPVLFSLPQVMVTNVTSLLKTVKAVEDEATKGTRALEATIEHIRQELAVSAAPRGSPPALLPPQNLTPVPLSSQVFSSPVPPAQVSTPEDFIRMTKGITMATAKAVAAGNSCRQEDVIATANLSRRAIADMLRACKVPRGWAGVVGRARGWGTSRWPV